MEFKKSVIFSKIQAFLLRPVPALNSLYWQLFSEKKTENIGLVYSYLPTSIKVTNPSMLNFKQIFERTLPVCTAATTGRIYQPTKPPGWQQHTISLKLSSSQPPKGFTFSRLAKKFYARPKKFRSQYIIYCPSPFTLYSHFLTCLLRCRIKLRTSFAWLIVITKYLLWHFQTPVPNVKLTWESVI